MVRESAAAGILRVGKEDGVINLADAFTKILARRQRYDLFSRIGYSSMFRDAASGFKRDHIPDQPEPTPQTSAPDHLMTNSILLLGHGDRLNLGAPTSTPSNEPHLSHLNRTSTGL